MNRRRAVEAAHVQGLYWLAIANGVGVLCALLLAVPALNRLTTPLVFGRWAPVHHNFQLYGWVSLPLIGMLFLLFRPKHLRGVRLALGLWAAALLLGGLTWLSGASSGKLFLEWTGPARAAFPAAMAVLWVVLAHAAWRDRGARRALNLARLAVLAALLPVPLVMYGASDPGVYPAVNPDSGGATGTSLLGSTLGLIAVFLVLPLLRGRRKGAHEGWYAAAWMVHMGVFAATGLGAHSHHETGQIVALGSLLVWVPLLVSYYRGFSWPERVHGWLAAFACQAGLLCLTGWLSFLPGNLERFKFTNMLVAHAHLAMAGMLTAFLMVLMLLTAPRLKFLANARGFWIWQLASLGHVAVLAGAGLWENAHPTAFFAGSGPREVVYVLRCVLGLAMWGASLYWAIAARKVVRAARFAAVPVPAHMRPIPAWEG